MSRRILRPLLSPVLRTSYGFLGRNLRGQISRLPGITPVYRRLMRPLLLPPEAEPGLVRVRFPDFSLYLDANDTGGEISLGKPWEPTTTFVFREMLRPGDVVIDVGAHFGYFTVLAATLTGPTGKIFAFEPHPGTYAVLLKNIAANGLKNVVATQKAASDRESTARLHLAATSDQHSIVHQPQQWGAAEGSVRQPIEVETIPLDDFLSESPVRPRLLKMDIEGAEPLALRGMERLISRNPQMAVIMELNPYFLDADAAEDLLKKLVSYGFMFVVVDDENDQLTAASSAEAMRRFLSLTKRSVLNLLCTRDESLIDRLHERRTESPYNNEVV